MGAVRLKVQQDESIQLTGQLAVLAQCSATLAIAKSWHRGKEILVTGTSLLLLPSFALPVGNHTLSFEAVYTCGRGSIESGAASVNIEVMPMDIGVRIVVHCLYPQQTSAPHRRVFSQQKYSGVPQLHMCTPGRVRVLSLLRLAAYRRAAHSLRSRFQQLQCANTE